MRVLHGSRLARLVTTSLVLALTFATGAAVVAIGAEAPPVYYGCVARAGGSLYAVSTSPPTCRFGDSQISWNQEGPQGLQGPAGPQGQQGIQGAQGPAGPSGADGLDGEPGLVWQGAYDPATTYAVGDAVLYNGSAYIAIATPQTGTPDASADWDLLAAKGEQGTQGPPGTNGADGEDGADGADGETGPRGPSDGWTIFKDYTGPVPIIGTTDVIVVSKTLPAGYFLLNGHVTLHNISATESASGHCSLSGNQGLDIPFFLDPLQDTTLPLTASHSGSSTWEFAIVCAGIGSGGIAVAAGGQANAVQVGTLH